MDVNWRDRFVALWRRHFDRAELPIAFYYTDREGSAQAAKNGGELSRHTFLGEGEQAHGLSSNQRRHAVMSLLTHLECASCGAILSADVPRNTCACGGMLLARYDWTPIRRSVTQETLRVGPVSLWRYAPFLPATHSEGAVTLAEGWAPLYRAHNLERALGCNALFITSGSSRIPAAKGCASTQPVPRPGRVWARARAKEDTHGNGEAYLAGTRLPHGRGRGQGILLRPVDPG